MNIYQRICDYGYGGCFTVHQLYCCAFQKEKESDLPVFKQGLKQQSLERIIV